MHMSVKSLKQLKRAVPRRVIFCIDLDNEMNETMSPSADGGKVQCLMHSSTRLQTALFLIKRFMHMALLLPSKDKFSIITMKDKAEMNMFFEDDQLLISEAIERLEATHYYDKFDTESLFNLIERNVDLSDKSLFTQVIVLYGRSETIPSLVEEDTYNRVRCSPNLTMDFVYIHQSPKHIPRCQQVFNFWCSLDSTKVKGWYYEFGHLGKSSFTRAMVQLIAHPLQRGDQMKMKMPIVSFYGDHSSVFDIIE